VCERDFNPSILTDNKLL